MNTSLYDTMLPDGSGFLPQPLSHEELKCFMKSVLSLCSNWKEILGVSESQKAENDSVNELLNLLLVQENDDVLKEKQNMIASHQEARLLDYSHELKDALGTLFGDPFQLKVQELQRWCNSLFEFAANIPQFNIGLLQYYGGPCGVLVSLQCWIISFLLLSLCSDEIETASSFAVSKKTKRCINEQEPCFKQKSEESTSSDQKTLQDRIVSYHDHEPSFFPQSLPTQNRVIPKSKNFFLLTQSERQKALAWAMAICLYRSTVKSYYVLATFIQPPHFSVAPIDSADFLNNTKMRVVAFESITKVYYELLYLLKLEAPIGILNFILSVVLTRGSYKVKCDMDDAKLSLIAYHGHSSQELVNLLLTGEAVSNTFDGFRTLEVLVEKLKGIQRQQFIGYLTQVEISGLCEVGKYYKFPILPLWVIGSANHFTTLFSLDARICIVTEFDKQLDSITRRFEALDTGSVGMIPSALLQQLLNSCELSEYFTEARKILDPPGQGDVILKYNFLEWAMSKLFKNPPEKKNQAGSVATTPPKRFIMYHYDGQSPPAPKLTVVSVEPVDFGFAVGDDNTAGNELGGIIRTKWKNAVVSIL